MRFLIGLLTVLIFAAGDLRGEHVHIYRPDSVGHKWENGKLFVLHKVEKGQTVFAISKRYGATVDAIKGANGGSIDVKEGQVVRVPYSRYRSTANAAPGTAGPEAAGIPAEAKPVGSPVRRDAAGTHTVEVGNTLYNIAAKYGISVADLKAWNGLKSDQVMLGQVLMVSSGKFAENNQAPRVSVAPADSVRTDVAAEKLVKAEPAAPPAAVHVKSVSQQGLAEKIDVGGSSSPKYLALHRDAPIGTLIQVTNQSNQEVIWAKVIGRIPDTSINEDIVVKLSGNAFDKISPQTRRFRAEVMYSQKTE
ncbi:MAG: hypothetical protein ABS46_17845 [Cytophagaceae bacterium SCN 52-12]|nr:MAG: hypothetical protein ABS46_17845 [Cytophagaceae bacterium SCN 52-12]